MIAKDGRKLCCHISDSFAPNVMRLLQPKADNEAVQGKHKKIMSCVI